MVGESVIGIEVYEIGDVVSGIFEGVFIIVVVFELDLFFFKKFTKMKISANNTNVTITAIIVIFNIGQIFPDTTCSLFDSNDEVVIDSFVFII